MPAHTRCIALAGALTGERKTTHTGRFPAITPEKMLPVADVLLIIADDDPGAMLFRYTAHGDHAGDTWHASVEDARAQAEYEFGDALLLPWLDVPDEITDAHDFAVQYALERLNDRGRW
jgi:hypothetical protein